MPDKKEVAALTAEFIGTFMLVLAVGCNAKTGNPTWAVTSIAATLMVMIYALGGVSGGHFNPAVSLAMLLTEKGEGRMMGKYVLVQFVAGTLAALLYTALLGSFNVEPATSWWQAMLAEVLYTFMLVFVVLNVACSKQHGGDADKNQFYGLAIAFVVVAGGYGAGRHSGGCFNPAIAVGADLASIMKGFGWGPLYTLCEFIGAALAVVVYRIVRPDDKCPGLPKTKAGQFPLSSRLVSEFLGTYMLVLTVGLNVLGKSPAAVWSIAASLMCMIYALGTVSGAHFNPAVTVAIACTGREKIVPKDAAAYVMSQFAGGFFGACTYALLEKGNTFPLQPGAGYGWVEAWGYETIFTFFLAFTVLCVATIDDSCSHVFGLAIGSCVTVGGYAIGAISGGSLNPAVSMGIAATSTLMKSTSVFQCIFYVIFECLGGALAAGVFRAMTHSELYGKHVY